mmetsp:Transcript_43904/g.95586  ORF Transcript_43904/g.95586 Transcript_43904/m.95586 type:complete len:285 (-) Transcript_43904:175-1029(-)|eukprot:CAMPEP_0170622904 /NCGR_PEP_ID=MMETSP0224-20130122/29388_1 /TAXON_ID=285029 /ORGANISM="Togula jolla, Strain CCCM 725" /LENGTH=284 /DNA_ID=CAMNT_0010949271 /DNA_START=366 /DNA_END=1220 /DNA_ORIENTATION=-
MQIMQSKATTSRDGQHVARYLRSHALLALFEEPFIANATLPRVEAARLHDLRYCRQRCQTHRASCFVQGQPPLSALFAEGVAARELYQATVCREVVEAYQASADPRLLWAEPPKATDHLLEEERRVRGIPAGSKYRDSDWPHGVLEVVQELLGGSARAIGLLDDVTARQWARWVLLIPPGDQAFIDGCHCYESSLVVHSEKDTPWPTRISLHHDLEAPQGTETHAWQHLRSSKYDPELSLGAQKGHHVLDGSVTVHLQDLVIHAHRQARIRAVPVHCMTCQGSY